MSSKLQELKAAASEKKADARHAFTSWAAFKEWVQVRDTALDEHGHAKVEMPAKRT